MGFLPGDLSQKIDPYLRPLYDALYELLGFDRVENLIEKNVIEVAPLADMRGRTLNDAFMILDESQAGILPPCGGRPTACERAGYLLHFPLRSDRKP